MNILKYGKESSTMPSTQQSQEVKGRLRKLSSDKSSPDGNRKRSNSWRVATSPEDITQKNRRVMNSHLKRLSAVIGTHSLSLDEKGICYFQYKKKYIIVIEVPKDELSGFFFIHTMVCKVNASNTEEMVAVMKESMTLNYMQQGTRGGTLGLDGDEINLCYSAPISSLNRGTNDLINSLSDFMETAVEMNERLEYAKKRARATIRHPRHTHSTS